MPVGYDVTETMSRSARSGSRELCPVLFEREEQERAFSTGFGTMKGGHC